MSEQQAMNNDAETKDASENSVKANAQAESALKKYQSVEGVALLILTLGEEIGAQVLRGFSHEQIKKVTHAMSKMNDIKAADAVMSLKGFFDDYRKHSGILGGTRKYITNVLEKTLNGNLAKDLVSEIYGDELRTLAQPLAWIPADILVNDLRKEHINMQALLIAHLPVDYIPKVLEEYSTEECNELIFQISKTEVLTASIADSLKELVDRCLKNYHTGSSQSINGTQVVADIINRYPGDKGSIFDYLHERDEEIAKEVENSMFDFYSLFNQAQDTIDEINGLVSLELWAVALKGISQENRLIIINSLPGRLSVQLKETIESVGAVPVSQVEAAREEILELVRQLQADGTITLSLSNEIRLS